MSEYPYTIARSTGSESDALLASILAVSNLDELSNPENFSAVERYIRNQGRINETQKTTRGLMFWIYPTGLHGPFHKSEEGETELHGTLVTIESGVPLVEAMTKVKEDLRDLGIQHLHIARN